MRIPPFLLRLQEFFPAYLPLIYLGYALPVTVAFALINPPFQVPDEFCHFSRTIQISSGHLFAVRSSDPGASLNNTSGGYIPTNAILVESFPLFGQMPFHIDTKFDPAMARQHHIFDVPWNDKVEFLSFANTATYPFTSYLPAATGTAIGRMTGLSILESFFTARLFNAFAAVLLSALAIHFVSRGKLIFTCVLSLPMTLFLFSSISQDAMLIAYTALSIGLLNRYLDIPQTRRSLWGLAFTFIFLVLSIIGRTPYLPFLFICALLAYFGAKSFKSIAITSGVAFAAVVSYVLSVRHLGYSIPPEIYPEHQAAFVSQHPFELLYMMLSTPEDYYRNYYHNFIGTLGWLDYELPGLFYPLVGCMLMVALISDFKLKDLALPPWSRCMTIIFVIGSVMLIYLAEFLVGTPNDRPHIEGVQGRYFLPVALMLSLAAGNRDASWMNLSPLTMTRFCANIGPLVSIALADFVACLSCLYRYYY